MTIGSIILALTSLGFTYLAVQFYRTCQDADARKLMFGSFAYLLIFLISLFF
jgi:heme O synthase-like polyprenyltransferase